MSASRQATSGAIRTARSGHVINISSVLGLTAFPGWSADVAAKFAVGGLTESLAAEMAHFDVKVNAVAPGYFNTSFLTSDSLRPPSSTSDGYPGIRKMIETHQAMPGSQPGDPVRAAAAIISMARTGTAPLHQVLGSDSHGIASGKVEALQADLDAGRELALSIDYPTVS